MPTIRLETELTPDGVALLLREATASPDVTKLFRVPLQPNRLARQLAEAQLLLTANGSAVVPARLRRHFTEHFTADATIDDGCAWCKLTGTVLAAEGRRRLTDREANAARITIVPQGVTTDALRGAEAARDARAALRAKHTPQIAAAALRNAPAADELF